MCWPSKPVLCLSARRPRGKIRLEITDPDGKKHEELVPKEKNILVHEGQVVNRGDADCGRLG